MNNNLGKKISVCLLTYNHVEVIESTLHTILDQSLSGYEVIVSDDCSTDGTWERILELAKTDNRIKPVQPPYNCSMPGNANFAISQSDRPYIALLHHDDLYRKDLLEKWAGILERHTEVGFVFNPYGVYKSDLIYQEPMPSECIDGDWLLKTYLFARWGCCVRGTAMIRRTAWTEVGGMHEQFGLLADVDLWMRLAMRGPVGYVSEPVITIRQQRPNYYPEIYLDGSKSFWTRQHFLYEIHAANQLTYLNLNSLSGRAQWWRFRLKLSIETSKWLIYGLVRKKNYLIQTSPLGAMQEEYFWVNWLRKGIMKYYLPENNATP